MRKRAPVSYRELLSQPRTIALYAEQTSEKGKGNGDNPRQHSTRQVREPKKHVDLTEASPRTKSSAKRKRTHQSSPPAAGFEGVLGKVRSALANIRRAQNFIEVYERDYNSELVKPEQDLVRANATIRRQKRKIREQIRQIDEHYKDRPHLLDESFDQDGIDAELITCSLCGIGDSSECNDVLLCDRNGCNRAFHQLCLSPPVVDVSNLPEDWFCPACDCALDCVDEVNYEFGTEYARATDMFPDVGEVSDTPETASVSSKRPQSQSRASRQKHPLSTESHSDDVESNPSQSSSAPLTSTEGRGEGGGGEGGGESDSVRARRPRRKAGKAAMEIVSSLLKSKVDEHMSEGVMKDHVPIIRDPVVQQLLENVNSDDDDNDFDVVNAADSGSDSSEQDSNNSDTENEQNTTNKRQISPSNKKNKTTKTTSRASCTRQKRKPSPSPKHVTDSADEHTDDLDVGDVDTDDGGSLDSFDDGVLLSDALGRGKRNTAKPNYLKLLAEIRAEGKQSSVFVEDEHDSDFQPGDDDLSS